MSDAMRLRHFLLPLFCLWHCAAVALYLMSVPSLPYLSTAIAKAKSTTTPYMQTLSQWQAWDIFSPDPMRRSSAYRIDVFENGVWKPVRTIDYASLHEYERAKELKILARLEDNWAMLVPFYLRPYCVGIPQSQGKTVRLVAVSVILPSRLDQLATLSQRHLEKAERVLGSVLCSHS